MSGAFTPGPWSSDDPRNPVFVPMKSVYCERIGFQIGFVNGHKEQEAEANARLIAAAPDLLHELQEILLWAKKEQAPLRDQEMNSIKRVIAKATGSAQ